jgi:hypothetical protein
MDDMDLAYMPGVGTFAKAGPPKAAYETAIGGCAGSFSFFVT